MRKSKNIAAVIAMMSLMLSGCGNSKFTDAELNVPAIAVSSSSINEEGRLLTATAAENRNDPAGDNHSPAVSWEAVEGANYYAVFLFDEDANWLHFLVTDVKDTRLEQGAYTGSSDYTGPYPPKSTGRHTYRIEVFAIKEQPKYPIAKSDSKNSYAALVNHLNQAGGNQDNILARGYVKGTYAYGDDTGADEEGK